MRTAPKAQTLVESGVNLQEGPQGSLDSPGPEQTRRTELLLTPGLVSLALLSLSPA